MEKNLLYQVRITLSDAVSEIVRVDPNNSEVGFLFNIAKKNDAQLICQYDAFVEYCREAEESQKEHFPLYKWTKATIENPSKREKYLKSFTFYIKGNQIYSHKKAIRLYEELQPLMEAGKINELKMLDNDPANNPQPPAIYSQT